MSTRYVWNRSDIEINLVNSGSGFTRLEIINGTEAYVYLSTDPNRFSWDFGSGDSASYGKFTSYDSRVRLTPSRTQTEVPSGYYFSVIDVAVTNPVQAMYRAINTCTITLEQNDNDAIIRGDRDDSDWYKATRGPGDNTTPVSNASSSTYPLNNNALAITNICAIIPQLIRGYKHVR